MSRENVEAFYKRLATDDAFKQLFQAVKSKEECSQIVKQHGYEFTQQEWEDYTANLLESLNDDGLVDLDEKELEAVMGGISLIKDEYWGEPKRPMFFPAYGLPIHGVWPYREPKRPMFSPMYGLPIYGVESDPLKYQ